MPELPDVELYVHALRSRLAGRTLTRVRLRSPFVLRTFTPSLDEAHGRRILGVTRLGKRIVWQLEGDWFLVFHLMIAGRFRWRAEGARVPGRLGIAAFDVEGGTVLLTEAGTSRQASLHVVVGREALAALDRGGLEVLDATAREFAQALRRERHTLKRALTDPRILSGIGNAYSDEILHAARLSPTTLTTSLTDADLARLHAATRDTLITWRDRLIAEAGDAFPEKVTAFRPGMAVHGRYGQPCPVCGTTVQRIRYASNESNYCPTCQTGGRLLADRSLSRLLRADWPKTAKALEERKGGSAPAPGGGGRKRRSP
ncbi:MAG: Fpg/Nei family DNA glycosylase [Vicinamibacterales bacterium]